MWWLAICGDQWLYTIRSNLKDDQDSGKVIKVPPYVRLFFGLAPSNNTLMLRPAIMQVLAIVMMIVSLVVRRSVAIQDSMLVFVLIGIYLVLVLAIFALLNR
jgi:hypothetical protein